MIQLLLLITSVLALGVVLAAWLAYEAGFEVGFDAGVLRERQDRLLRDIGPQHCSRPAPLRRVFDQDAPLHVRGSHHR